MHSSIYIKNMVCNRCISVVNEIFNSQDLQPLMVTLGEVMLSAPISSEQEKALSEKLMKQGFELIDDQKSLLLERAKTLIIEAIHHQDHFEMKVNWSHYLAEKLNVDYGHLSTLFSSISGITLEQYIIKQKVEKIKEFLFYDELSIKEIAFKLGYSSIAHLSTQFKKVTGFTPTEFKESREPHRRNSLDHIL